MGKKKVIQIYSILKCLGRRIIGSVVGCWRYSSVSALIELHPARRSEIQGLTVLDF